MSLISKNFKRLLSRLLIYQAVLILPIMRLIDLDSYLPEFKEKLFQNLFYFGVRNDSIYLFAKDPNSLLLLSVLQILAGVFAIFGSFYGNLLSALLFVLNSLIYLNPLLPTNNYILLNEPRNEILYNIGILLAILLCTFNPIDTRAEFKESNGSSNDLPEDLPEQKNTNKSSNNSKNKKGKKH